ASRLAGRSSLIYAQSTRSSRLAIRAPRSGTCATLHVSRGLPVSVLAAIFVSDILPIFAIATVGFLLARLLNASVKTLAHVVFYALVPCLVFNLLITSRMSGAQFGRMAAMSALLTLSMGIVA